MSESLFTGRNLDRAKTEFQETGRLYMSGFSLAEVAEIVNDLGVDPARTIFDGAGFLRIRGAVTSAPKPSIEWTDVRAGDEISLLVLDRQEGLQRERRRIVSVEWPKVALADGERIYSINATSKDSLNERSLRLESREES